MIENRPGAGGVLGSDLVAKAEPDGYTLVVSGVASHAIAPALPRGTPYDPLRDFTHIALFGGPPAVMAVNPGVPAKDLKEFIALLKAQPGKFSYGSPGNGTHGHLVAEQFKQVTGTDMQHVPYKGAVQRDLRPHRGPHSGRLHHAHHRPGAIHGGKARALAISTEHRLPDYPNVPTYAELGYKDLTGTIWFSLSGPARLPAEVVEKGQPAGPARDGAAGR